MPETAPPLPGWPEADPSTLPEFLRNLPPHPNVPQFSQFPSTYQELQSSRRTAETSNTMPETALETPGRQDKDPSTLPEFLRDMPRRPDVSQYPQFPDDKQSSFGGYGTLEARQATRILEEAGIPCCICGVGALIYYGAARVRKDWEICVPSESKDRAEALLKSEKYVKEYISLPPWPFKELGSLSHTYTRFKSIGVSFYFVLVPAKDIHLPCEPGTFQRSHHDLPYPKLDVLIQSFLEMNNHVSLADVIDGSNVSEEWGVENLDLEGEVDLEWAKWKNGVIRQHAGKGPTFLLNSIERVEKRALWESMVRNKGGRRGWTQPTELFATRFRLHGDSDPWLEKRDSC